MQESLSTPSTLSRERFSPTARQRCWTPRFGTMAAWSLGFSGVISVDQVKTYKPCPRVYQLGVETFQVSAEEILFVSSNAWDAAGAKAFGYSVCWCNRSARPKEHLGFAPDIVVTSLDQLSLL